MYHIMERSLNFLNQCMDVDLLICEYLVLRDVLRLAKVSRYGNKCAKHTLHKKRRKDEAHWYKFVDNDAPSFITSANWLKAALFIYTYTQVSESMYFHVTTTSGPNICMQIHPDGIVSILPIWERKMIASHIPWVVLGHVNRPPPRQLKTSRSTKNTGVTPFS